VKFALEVRPGRLAASEFAADLAEMVAKAGGEVLTEDDVAPDMVVAVGGDGTMLAAVRRALAWDVPVLGFNMGTLGFLAGAEQAEGESVVGRLLSGQFDVEERTTVAASIGGVVAVGINDVVVEKLDSTRLVSLAVAIDGVPFVKYQADGLIVATPTGSTAYSFSARGPLIDPSVDALVMTPVASHSLFDRSIVLPGTAEIKVTIVRDRKVKVHVDKTDLGQLGEGESVTIVRSERPAKFVVLNPQTFPSLVKEKFGLE
jgi:NAD+ kinase